VSSLLLLLSLAQAGESAPPAAETPAVPAPAPSEQRGIVAEAKDFLDFYNSTYLALVRASQEAAWEASTNVSEANEGRRTGTSQSYAAFTGSTFVVERTKHLLEHRQELDPLAVRQLEAILRLAADSPGTIPDVVNNRLAEESRQASLLDGFVFCYTVLAADGSCPEPKTANDIDEVLLFSTDLAERQRVWQSSKEIGKVLKPGLARLQKLRNQVAREMGYSSFFALQVDSYGMQTEEMMGLLDGLVTESRPLYHELQIWAGRKLAAKYGQPRPGKEPLPAHWYPNRWGQEWSGLVEGADLDGYFTNRSPQWIVQQAEAFYVSMGFASLSPSFWARSDLYPVPEGDSRHKNAHASAWHIDLDQDIRSLMSVESDAQWFFTSHHELGHVYYFQAYSRPEVPPVLREGANRAFHEAVGELASLAAGQVPYLKAQGFLPKKAKINPTQAMLVDALERTVVFLPWSAGVMSHFEYELYEKNLPPEKWQERWWEMVKEYQNMVPPGDRSDAALCDACTKTHINDDPAAYYDYALATVIKYQLHEHIAKKILKQDPRSCNYYGNKEVGAYLKKILEQGATRDWRDILRDATGEELSTRAMMDYYKPLLRWLKQQNGSE
jgi:peptidyl-dipeptidase A